LSLEEGWEVGEEERERLGEATMVNREAASSNSSSNSNSSKSSKDRWLATWAWRGKAAHR